MPSALAPRRTRASAPRSARACAPCAAVPGTSHKARDTWPTSVDRRPPLADLRVIAVEQFGAGPWASMQLADLGADVIKIEDPRSGGDVGRYVPPLQDGEDSMYFEAFNRGKRSL